MEPSHGIGGGVAIASPTIGARPSTATSNKRKRSGVENESSPGTANEVEEESEERRRQPGVKRACNECRQQKLRCDVIQEPFQTCGRCSRLKLECKIESHFKRVGKRSKHAEMEKQIERLQRQLNRARQAGFQDDEEDHESPMGHGMYQHSRNPSYMGSEEAVSSLLHLKQGGSYNNTAPYARQIENVGLTVDSINVLFNAFFVWYHPFLPFLSAEQSPDQYFQQDPLLFWAIITVAARRNTADSNLLMSLNGPVTRFMWSKVGEVPSNYFIVKALILFCTWPLPVSTSSADITHILCGVMMKAATGIGLHRPNHTQDFSRVSVDLNREQLHDRVVTWAVCNIVAQSTATGFGQPASTLYDWSLAVRPGDEGPFTLSPELSSRLTIERFCDKVSKEMYSNANDPRGVAGDEARALITRVYRREFEEIRVAILSKQNLTPIVDLHLHAAGLHLRLSAFFDSSSTQGYLEDLMGLWRATSQFLDLVFELEDSTTGDFPSGILKYATGYILQMIVAACFSLLKLLGSFFAKMMNFDHGRKLFHRTISAIRTVSIMPNDLPSRLAELMVQMYNGARVEQRQIAKGNDNELDSTTVPIDGSLQLKVRCRMSMSLVYDSIWRWREEFQTQGRSIEAAMRNPTNPDSANESSDSSTQLDNTLIPASHQMSNHVVGTDTITSNDAMMGVNNMLGGASSYVETNYEVFDPLNWMLDGLVDFPYNFTAVQALEANNGLV